MENKNPSGTPKRIDCRICSSVVSRKDAALSWRTPALWSNSCGWHTKNISWTERITGSLPSRGDGLENLSVRRFLKQVHHLQWNPRVAAYSKNWCIYKFVFFLKQFSNQPVYQRIERRRQKFKGREWTWTGHMTCCDSGFLKSQDQELVIISIFSVSLLLLILSLHTEGLLETFQSWLHSANIGICQKHSCVAPGWLLCIAGWCHLRT